MQAYRVAGTGLLSRPLDAPGVAPGRSECAPPEVRPLRCAPKVEPVGRLR